MRDGDVVKMTRKYDPEDTGSINYHELLKELRGGDMPAQRVQVCRDAFDKIGQHHGTSRVTLLDMDAENARIVGDLEIGTSVISLGTHLLQSGMPVRALE